MVCQVADDISLEDFDLAEFVKMYEIGKAYLLPLVDTYEDACGTNKTLTEVKRTLCRDIKVLEFLDGAKPTGRVFGLTEQHFDSVRSYIGAIRTIWGCFTPQDTVGHADDKVTIPQTVSAVLHAMWHQCFAVKDWVVRQKKGPRDTKRRRVIVEHCDTLESDLIDKIATLPDCANKSFFDTPSPAVSKVGANKKAKKASADTKRPPPVVLPPRPKVGFWSAVLWGGVAAVVAGGAAIALGASALAAGVAAGVTWIGVSVSSQTAVDLLFKQKCNQLRRNAARTAAVSRQTQEEESTLQAEIRKKTRERQVHERQARIAQQRLETYKM
ncbi:hypothetical protein KIPB_007425 [Kipferlia bialata]|uniref:Uncharacterized protein n=1 Tax=Kipferlia bialata TaxID=797122 RepID=A0A9K3CYQ8_9EUKA|nr:hypothetical protein KIPB_007425 [Kipferlia bialata]|eukprot:g7425.t1